ncbi:MAG: hypothetical protein HEQ38_12530 [Gemmatimonas sp.]|nr:hypothetical protein [Gemmatimonas sp.]
MATAPRPDVWDEVSAEPDLCGRLTCEFYDKCFLFKARKEAANADVVVVNHHLLLSDLAVRRQSQNWDDAAVLPAYKRLVVDEGHHLEDAGGIAPGKLRSRAAPSRACSTASRSAARACCRRSRRALPAARIC